VSVSGDFISQRLRLTLNRGDWIEISVTNNITEGTSLHWHGLLQNGTPWFDGVPAVTQSPIAPGDTLVYKFRADLFGTSW
jgi:FtsP/CotA-like multicopper oxidase with cupredoxin domain